MLTSVVSRGLSMVGVGKDEPPAPTKSTYYRSNPSSGWQEVAAHQSPAPLADSPTNGNLGVDTGAAERREVQFRRRLAAAEAALRESTTAQMNAFTARITTLEALVADQLEVASASGGVRTGDAAAARDGGQRDLPQVEHSVAQAAEEERGAVYPIAPDVGSVVGDASSAAELSRMESKSSTRRRVRHTTDYPLTADTDKELQATVAALRSNVDGKFDSMVQKDDSESGVPAAAEQEPPPDISGMVNTYAIATAKVVEASSLPQFVSAAAWIGLSLLVSVLQVFFALAMMTSLSWGKCHGATECKVGMACISYINEDGSMLTPACEDCFFLAERAGAPLDELYPHQFETASTGGNASEYCLAQLEALAPALTRAEPSKEPSFAQCLYVQAAYLTMSQLEKGVMTVAMIAVALAIAQEWSEWSRLRWLRRRCVPSSAWPARPRDASATFRWVAAWTLRLIEVLSMQGMVALIPATMLLLLFATGVDSASILLNGLSVVFILTFDNFFPLALLDAESIQHAADVLAAAAVLSLPEDVNEETTGTPPRFTGLRSFAAKLHVRTTRRTHSACMKWGARATAVLNMVVLNQAFYSAGRVKCELLIHTFYYRVSITFCTWGAVIVRSLVNLLVHVGELWALPRPLDTRTVAVWAASGLIRAAESFVSTLLAAIVLNTIYWYCINVLYYEDSKALDLFDDYVWDVFGLCANGPPWNGACQAFYV